MARYTYEGFTKDGVEESGTCEAKSLEAAAEHVRNLKVFARKIEPAEDQPTLAPAPTTAPIKPAVAVEKPAPKSPAVEVEVDWKELLKERLALIDEIIAVATEANPSWDLRSIGDDMRRGVIFGIFSDLTD